MYIPCQCYHNPIPKVNPQPDPPLEGASMRSRKPSSRGVSEAKTKRLRDRNMRWFVLLQACSDIHIYICIYIYIYAYTYTYVYVYMYVYIYIYIHIHMCIYIYIYIYICMYVCMYVSICICMYMYVYMFIYIYGLLDVV